MRCWIAASLLVVWSLMTVTAVADAKPGLEAQPERLHACIDGPSPPSELPQAILSEPPQIVPPVAVVTACAVDAHASLCQRSHDHPSARAPPRTRC